MTFGRSLGPIKIRARIATTASSEESTPNIRALQGLARFVVSRGSRRDGIFAARGHIDRTLRTRVVARKLARRLGAALLVVTLTLVVILVRHALLEALEAFGDVSHHRREAVATEQQQQDDREDQDMPNA